MAMASEEGKTSLLDLWVHHHGLKIQEDLWRWSFWLPLKEMNQAKLMLCLVAVPLVFVVIETSWAFSS